MSTELLDEQQDDSDRRLDTAKNLLTQGRLAVALGNNQAGRNALNAAKKLQQEVKDELTPYIPSKPNTA